MIATLPEIDRSDCVHVVQRNGEPFLFHAGEQFVWSGLPAGTRVIYPPPPLPAIEDVDSAIEEALENPLGADPLSAQLRPGMRLTVAFDDISLPLPPMRTPDVRQRVIEKILAKCAAQGVEDIHLICAIALHRKMTGPELREVLGSRIFDEFHPKGRLYNHDAEDPNGNVLLGKTERDEEVWINKRVAESDLLIYVNINLVTMDGGHKSINTGLTTYRTIRHHHNVHTLMNCKSYMDPRASMLQRTCERMGRIVAPHVKSFHVETTLNSNTFPPHVPQSPEAGTDLERLGLDQLPCQSLWPQGAAVWPAPAHLDGPTRPLRHDRHHGRQCRSRPRTHRRERPAATGGEGQRAERCRGDGTAVPVPVQRQLDHEPDSAMGDNGRLRLQPLSRPAIGAPGRRPDLHSSALQSLEYRASSELCRVLRSSFDANTQPRGHGVEVRAGIREQREVHQDVPRRKRLPRRASVLHVVLGHLRSGLVRQGDRGRRRSVRGGSARVRHGADHPGGAEQAQSIVGASPSVTYYHWPPIFLCDVE